MKSEIKKGYIKRHLLPFLITMKKAPLCQIFRLEKSAKIIWHTSPAQKIGKKERNEGLQKAEIKFNFFLKQEHKAT